MKQLNISRLVEQPSSSYEVIADGAEIRTVRKYVVSESTWYEQRPLLYSQDPEYPQLTLRRYTAEKSEGSMRLLTLYYEANTESDEDGGGGQPGRDLNRGYGSLDIVVDDQPILANKIYVSIPESDRKNLIKIFSGQDKDESGAELDTKIESELGKQVLGKFRSGIKTSREPKVVWSFRRRVLRLEKLSDIGRISVPKGDAPAVSSGYDWLNIGTSANQSSDQSSFDQIERWELSGPNGWDKDLYE